jgi:hypothetical protein
MSKDLAKIEQAKMQEVCQKQDAQLGRRTLDSLMTGRRTLDSLMACQELSKEGSGTQIITYPGCFCESLSHFFHVSDSET